MTNTSKKATLEDAWAVVESLGQAQKELRRELEASKKETDRQLRETAKQLKETDRRFNSQWGKLIESLVEGDLVRRLHERGITVGGIHRNSEKKFNGKDYEFDLMALSEESLVVVEVKTVLNPQKVDHFLDKMKDFKKVFSEYADRNVYGAVAYIKADASSDKYSERHGLFVIRATGNSSSITNAEDFQPKPF